MTYRVLPGHLHDTADLVQRYMRDEFGLTKISIEKEIDPHIGYRPTLSGRAPCERIRCVEVSESIITTPIINFILECKLMNLPALLSVAIPAGDSYKEFRKHMKQAKSSGIGVLEVDHGTRSVACIRSPLSLSLTGLRRFDKRTFPPKYREPLLLAEETFLNGNPVKGCAGVYDEIERLTRRIACKTYKKGCWDSTVSHPEKMAEKTAWGQVLKNLRDKIDRQQCLSRGWDLTDLSDVLLNRVIGTTPPRNDSGHKPSTLKKIHNRDAKLRTRMEDAFDLLAEIIKASKDLRV